MENFIQILIIIILLILLTELLIKVTSLVLRLVSLSLIIFLFFYIINYFVFPILKIKPTKIKEFINYTLPIDKIKFLKNKINDKI